MVFDEIQFNFYCKAKVGNGAGMQSIIDIWLSVVNIEKADPADVCRGVAINEGKHRKAVSNDTVHEKVPEAAAFRWLLQCIELKENLLMQFETTMDNRYCKNQHINIVFDANLNTTDVCVCLASDSEVSNVVSFNNGAVNSLSTSLQLKYFVF